MNDMTPAPRATEPIAAATPPRPSLSELFIAYALISLYGFGGGLVALGGVLGPPMLLIVIIGALYSHYGDLPALRRALIGVTAAAAGLIMSTVAKMALPLFHNRAVGGPVIALATFGAIGIAQWPLPIVLVVVLPISLALAWVRR